MSRREPGAVLHDPDEVAERSVRMATRQEVVAADGSVVAVSAGSVCVHGDSAGRGGDGDRRTTWSRGGGRPGGRVRRRGRPGMRLLPCGDSGLLVELADLDAVLALYAELVDDPPEGVVDLVPAARTLMLRIDPARTDPARVGPGRAGGRAAAGHTAPTPAGWRCRSPTTARTSPRSAG